MANVNLLDIRNSSLSTLERITSKDIYLLDKIDWALLLTAWEFPGLLEFDVPDNNLAFFSIDHWGDDELLLLPNADDPVEKLRKVLQNNKGKHFYCFTVCPFFSEFFKDYNNIDMIHWGDEFLLQPSSNNYGCIKPVGEKTFSQDHHWIFTSRNRRFHRAIFAIFLLGMKVPNGLIRIDPSYALENNSWPGVLDYLAYNNYHYLNSILSTYQDILKHGFHRLKSGDGFYSLERDSTDVNHNPWVLWPITLADLGGCLGLNFDLVLRKIYLDTVVEIVGETVFLRRTGHITEKFCNSVIGYNFPIMLAMSGSVQYLRDLGFDMFDDVIDHSYDHIKDPYLRMVNAITENLKILHDRKFAVTIWHKCRARFDANYDLMTSLYANAESVVQQNILKHFLKSKKNA